MGSGQLCLLQTCGVHGVGMVLRGYLNFSGEEILYGMVAAAVTEFKLICLCTVSERNYLMSEADAENRQFSTQQTDSLDDGRQIGGITGRNVEPDLLEKIFHRFCIGK